MPVGYAGNNDSVATDIKRYALQQSFRKWREPVEKEECCNRCRKILWGTTSSTTVCVATASASVATLQSGCFWDGGDGRVTVQLPVLQQAQGIWIWMCDCTTASVATVTVFLDMDV
jgi:hypothetical protein